jgi:hypothetical protein
LRGIFVLPSPRYQSIPASITSTFWKRTKPLGSRGFYLIKIFIVFYLHLVSGGGLEPLRDCSLRILSLFLGVVYVPLIKRISGKYPIFTRASASLTSPY